jgi:hypothetical protein
MQQFSSLLSWRLFTAQHVSGFFPPIIRSSMTAVAASGFTFVSWWQLCYVHGRAGRPDHEHSTKPVTCWAVNKRQDNKLQNCCIWLVIYLNCTMMHGLTNLKFPNKLRALIHSQPIAISNCFIKIWDIRLQKQPAPPFYCSYFSFESKDWNKEWARQNKECKEKKEHRKYALQRCLHLEISSPTDTSST